MADEEPMDEAVRLSVRRMKKRPSVWPTVAACGAFAWLVGSLLTPSLGAARSVKLKWDERKADVEREVGGANAEERAPWTNG